MPVGQPFDRGPTPGLIRHLSPLNRFSGILLAVSGGPDSTALMVLAAHWRNGQAAKGGLCPAIHVAVVDHGLRRESSQEAAQAVRNARSLGFPARIMDAEVERSGNIQSAARQARYGCLVAAARESGCQAIATGHHRDDQAETVLFRLLRGAGVFGLAGMAGTVAIDDHFLVRPLLDVPRDTLRAVALGSGLPVADDPTNRDDSFDRVWVRSLLADETAGVPDRDALVALAARARQAADAIDVQADRLLALFSVDPHGCVGGPRGPLARAPVVVARRAVWRMVRAAGGGRFGAPADKIGRIVGQLRAEPPKPLKRTLAGAVIGADADRLYMAREWGRAGPQERDVVPGDTVIWDRRFAVKVPDRLADKPLRLRAVGKGWEPAAGSALATMPGLYCRERLIAVPDGVRREARCGGEGPMPGRVEVTCLVDRIMRQPRAILVEEPTVAAVSKAAAVSA